MGSSTKKTKTNTQNTLPAYMVQGSEAAVSRATEINNRPYEAYGGQRIADLTQNEQMGIDAAGGEYGRYDEDWDNARGALDAAGGSITDEGALEGYMNPYMEEVLAPQRRRQNEAFEAERAERSRTSGMRNSFGGRSQMYDNQFVDQFQTRQTELTGSAYGAAFDRATGLFGQERDRDLRRASAYGNVATGQGNQVSQQIRNMMDTGRIERTQEQADLDFQYLEHLEERDWDITNLSVLVDTLASVPSESGQQSTTTETEKANPMKAMIGIGMIAVGALMAPMTGGASLPLMTAGGEVVAGA